MLEFVEINLLDGVRQSSSLRKSKVNEIIPFLGDERYQAYNYLLLLMLYYSHSPSMDKKMRTS